jgi:hypothetical protein
MLAVMVSGLVMGLIAAPQKEVQTADRVYEGNGVKLEGLGVCSIAADAVSCWDMDGISSSSLTDTVKARLDDRDNQSFYFRFGRKNRFLVTRMTADSEGKSTYPQSDLGTFELDQNQGGNLRHTWLCGVAVEPTLATASVKFNINGIPGPAPAKLIAKTGSTVKFGDATYEFGAAKEVKPDPRNGNMPVMDPNQQKWGKSYLITIGIQGSEDQVYKNFAAFDRGGNAIRYVDAKGKIVSPLEYLQENPNSNNYGRPAEGSKYRPATLALGGSNVPGAIPLYTNIDPSQIDSISISGTMTKTVELTGFPLDPK